MKTVQRPSISPRFTSRFALLLWWFLVTLLALAVLGYHPYAEDGALYLAEIKHLIDPSLYPFETAFVTEHLGTSLFGTFIVAIMHLTSLSLSITMLFLHALSVGGLLLGAWVIAGYCHASFEARAGSVGLLALAMGMPVAGTSLMLMDPYLTARSLVTALVVLGIACLVAFRRQGRRSQLAGAVGAFALAVVLHPLMGGFGVGAAAVLMCLTDTRRSVRLGGVVTIGLVTLAGAAVIQAVAPLEPVDYIKVAATRYYWFLADWHWYEDLGLFGPLAILGWVAVQAGGAERALARMSVFVGGLGIFIAVFFARQGARVHAVARLQPLRCFLVVYVVLLIVLGAWLGERVLRRSGWRWGLAALGLSVGMTAVQRETYPASDHVELPHMTVRNEWEQAFFWIRANTPRDAFFALDADYVHRIGEDAQGFRAIAERSALPDYSKDGGQASIHPRLTAQWMAAQTAQARLTQETDKERLAALRDTGVSWVVLGREAIVGFVCPYRNALVTVCQVPRNFGER